MGTDDSLNSTDSSVDALLDEVAANLRTNHAKRARTSEESTAQDRINRQ